MKELMQYLGTSFTAYHAVDNARALLLQEGFEELRESEKWALAAGKRYFVVRGGSALIAFTAGDARKGFKIVASHTDSPALKLKENAALSDGNCTRLNTEPYGGGLWYTFFDRPLRLAGRVVREQENGLVSESFASKFLVTLPSLAIHLNRTANEKFAPEAQKDLPLLSLGAADFSGVTGDALSYDLFAACAQEPYLWGENDEFLAAPRIDNLASVYASLTTLAQGANGVCVAACLDSEEVGSRTRQGAAGDFLSCVLRRIASHRGWMRRSYCAPMRRPFASPSTTRRASTPTTGKSTIRRSGHTSAKASPSRDTRAARTRRTPSLRCHQKGVHACKRPFAGVLQPLGRAQRLHAGRHQPGSGLHPDGGHRAPAARHALRRGEHRLRRLRGARGGALRLLAV